MRGVMDAVSDPTVRQVVVMYAAQVGKTEVLLNMIGFHVDQDPAPILVVQPTLSMAQAFSKDRLAPMLRDTPNLKGKVRERLLRPGVCMGTEKPHRGRRRRRRFSEAYRSLWQ